MRGDGVENRKWDSVSDGSIPSPTSQATLTGIVFEKIIGHYALSRCS